MTRINSVVYPSEASPLSVIPEFSSLRMTGVTFHIADDMIAADNGYTHLIVKIEPTESSTRQDEVAVNDYITWPISIASSATSRQNLCSIVYCKIHKICNQFL